MENDLETESTHESLSSSFTAHGALVLSYSFSEIPGEIKTKGASLILPLSGKITGCIHQTKVQQNKITSNVHLVIET